MINETKEHIQKLDEQIQYINDVKHKRIALTTDYDVLCNYLQQYKHSEKLLNMKAKHFTNESLNKLVEKNNNHIKTLNELLNTTPQQAWNQDLHTL